MSTYKLAPMSAKIRTITWVLYALPFGMLMLMRAVPPVARIGLILATVFVAILYCIVWKLLRPTEFALNKSKLAIRWPWRKREIDLTSVAGAQPLSKVEFIREYGTAVRVGAGGLWGGFGFLLTKKGRVDFYISTEDDLVLLQMHSGPPLLITPENPSSFVAEIQASLR